MSSTTTAPGATTTGPAWHTLSVSDALQHEEVDPVKGLSASDAAERLQKFGPNAFAQAKKQPGYVQFLNQYRDPMQIVLLGAAVISIIINEWSTLTPEGGIPAYVVVCPSRRMLRAAL
jgi:Ca2+-transporting ATPase